MTRTKMNKIYCSLFLLVLCMGCASVESINKNYAKINFKNGLSNSETKVMAQKALLDSGQIARHMYDKPILDNDLYVEKRYLNYAFVHFAPEIGGDEGFLVIINKELAEVKYAGVFNPVKNKGYDEFFQ